LNLLILIAQNTIIFCFFKKAVFLTIKKEHLQKEGKLKIIKYKEEMQKISNKWIPSFNNNINITKYWLAGFIDAKGTFSINKYMPRFKLENHVRELILYNKIREFINEGNIILNTPKAIDNPTIILEISKVNTLINNLIPLMYNDDKVLLQTLKSQDFYFWLKLVNIYYKGYHILQEGKYVFDAIKLHMNKYRLTTNNHLIKNKNFISIKEINKLLSGLYLLQSPYEIREGLRYYYNSNKLVSESINIIAINNNKRTIYNSISDCSKNTNISIKNIKKCLSLGIPYKEYYFVLS